MYLCIIDGHLGSFKFWAIMNRGAMNICIHACAYVHVSDEYMPKSENVASTHVQHEELSVVFQSSSANLHR